MTEEKQIEEMAKDIYKAKDEIITEKRSLTNC